ncbi:hypothetical protein P3T39_007266 [Kitasatospora sp. GP82]|nr:hypothetical protein [Kitasatospora sp. GP82]
MRRTDRIKISEFREGLTELFSELAENDNNSSRQGSESYSSPDGHTVGIGNDSGSPVIFLPEQLSE